MANKPNNKSFGTLLNPETIIDIEDITQENIPDKFSFEKKIPEFEKYVSEYLKAKKSLVVGIYGDYGSGKSVFVNLLKNGVKKEKTEFLTFHAWKYKDEKSIWRNFVLYVSEKLKNKKHDELQTSLYHTNEKRETNEKYIWYSLIGLFLSSVILSVILQNTIIILYYMFPLISTIFLIHQYYSIKRIKQPPSSIEEFETEFEKILVEKNNDYDKIYIVIENIDRCLPHHAIRLLESLNAFIEMPETKKEKPQCIFLIPCDKNMLEEAIKKECGNLENMDASAYLDKLIQLPYDLPVPSNDHYKEYIESLLNEKYKSERPRIKCIIEMLEISGITNPREIKILFREWEMRFVNLNSELKYIDELKEEINLDSALILLKLLILKKKYPWVYDIFLDISLTAENFIEKCDLNKIIEFMFNKETGDFLCDFLWVNRMHVGYEDKINQIKWNLYHKVSLKNDPKLFEKEEYKRKKIIPAFRLLKYGTIKPKSFKDFKKFMLTTRSLIKELASEMIKFQTKN